MRTRAVISDIGGVLEIGRDGLEPTHVFPEVMAKWERRLTKKPGELTAELREVNKQLLCKGKSGELGTCTEQEWLEQVCIVTGMSPVDLGAFSQDLWNIYLGELNEELAAYFKSLRPRYKTALLSNSFVGAREREQERYKFADMVDLIIYSHEVGMAKPDRRIYELTCERLGVSPEESILLDDAEKSIDAARDLGMQAILYRNTAQAIAEIKTCLAVC
jgi:epoxide hydrolase-like predicted phosphatase